MVKTRIRGGNEYFLLGVNLLILVFAWKVFWQPLRLHICRDRLFTIREEIRAYFVANNLGLDSKAYKFTRDYINIQIHYAKELSFIKFLIMHRYLNDVDLPDITGKALQGMKKEHKEHIEQLLFSGIEEIAKYMITRSVVAIIFTSAFAIVELIRRKNLNDVKHVVHENVSDDIKRFSLNRLDKEFNLAAA